MSAERRTRPGFRAHPAVGADARPATPEDHRRQGDLHRARRHPTRRRQGKTSEPGLYGLGCATFTQRPLAVVTAIEEYLKPFLIGRDPDDIEDIWQAAFVSSYWRSGPVLNNALSGMDEALWDIKGKRAGMPRLPALRRQGAEGRRVYAHACGRDFAEVEDSVRECLEQGYRYVRARSPCPAMPPTARRQGRRPGRRATTVQRLASPGRLGAAALLPARPAAVRAPARHASATRSSCCTTSTSASRRSRRSGSPRSWSRTTCSSSRTRSRPRTSSTSALMRQQTSHAHRDGRAVRQPERVRAADPDRLIDFIRVHISDIGGLSRPASSPRFASSSACGPPGTARATSRRSATPRTSSSTSPRQLRHPGGDLFGERTREVFPGCPEIRDGAMWANDKPGPRHRHRRGAGRQVPLPEHASTAPGRRSAARTGP